MSDERIADLERENAALRTHVSKLNKESADHRGARNAARRELEAARVELDAYRKKLTDPETGEVVTPDQLGEIVSWDTEAGESAADESEPPEAAPPELPEESSPDVRLAVARLLARVRTSDPDRAEELLVGAAVMRDGKLAIATPEGDLELTAETLPAVLPAALLPPRGVAGSGGRTPKPLPPPVRAPEDPTSSPAAFARAVRAAKPSTPEWERLRNTALRANGIAPEVRK